MQLYNPLCRSVGLSVCHNSLFFGDFVVFGLFVPNDKVTSNTAPDSEHGGLWLFGPNDKVTSNTAPDSEHGGGIKPACSEST